MAVVLFKVHVEELTYPYRRELVETFPTIQYDEVSKFVETFNNARSHIWSFKLEAKIDKSITVVDTKIIKV